VRFVFDAAAVVAILFAAFMVLGRNAVRSVLSLVVAFFALAVCYVTLYAPLIAAVQVIVYAGAILVLFLFVLMLLNVPEEAMAGESRPIQHYLGGAAILVFTVGLIGAFSRSPSPPAPSRDLSGLGEIAPLARQLYSDYLLSFEALSVLLLAALVGAFALVQREKRR
jgi:NADH-quinone oxidoreductase subunit J